MNKHITPADAAALIPDGAIVSVSSSSGLGCPDLMLKAIGERFDATAIRATSPRCTRSPPAT
jgi:propionate CoA-transferase